MLCLGSGMPSLPASQLADDGEAVGTPVPPAYDPSSEEPLPIEDGVRKSVAPATIGRRANATSRTWVSSVLTLLLGWHACSQNP